MFRQENKIIIYIVISLSTILGCRNKNSGDLYSVSISTVGKEEYERVQQLIKDTISSWRNNRLMAVGELWRYDYKIDSLICFNENGNKFIGCVMVSCVSCKNEDLRYLYGVKIYGNWHFVLGEMVVLIRGRYKKNINETLSWDKLHEIALDEIYNGYLIQKDKGCEINPEFFKNMSENDAYNMPFTTQEAWEASYLKLVGENWQKRDTTARVP